MENEELGLARELWGEIRESLSRCGDIGEFSPEDFVLKDMPRVIWRGKPVLPLPVLRRLRELEGEINEIFWNVYEALGIAAGRKLGLDEELSIAFADSLAIIRTGMAGGHRTQAEQCIAQEIFLSGASYSGEWNPSSTMVQTGLSKVFNKFRKWQEDRRLHREEVKRFWGEMSS